MYGYYCNICNKDHQMNSKIGQEHLTASQKIDKAKDKEADERRKHEIKPTKEETDKKLYNAIFGDKKES